MLDQIRQEVRKTNGPYLVFCGFSDTSNIGDFAIYLANLNLFGDRLFRQSELIELESSHQLVNLFGGGTYYPYALRGQFKRRAMNYAVGVGVHEPEGRFGALTRLAMWRWRFGFLGVRGFRSEQVLRNHSIKCVVTGDTAMAIDAPKANVPENGTIGVSLVGESMDRSGSQRKVFAETERACLKLLAEGVRIRLFAFCKADLQEATKLRERLNPFGEVEFVDYWKSPINEDLFRFLSEMERCQAFVGERLHASVLAAVVNRPFVPIGYKPKCRDFVESLKIERFECVDPCSINAEQLSQRVLDALDEFPDRSVLGERVDQYRGRLCDAAAEIKASLRKLGHQP